MTPEAIKEHHDKCENAKAEIRARGFRGPWDDEPNRFNWSHAGLDCMLVRHGSSLNWCGYVGVKPDHKAFGKNYNDVQSGEWCCEKNEYKTPAIFPDLDVHGGLTFSDQCGGVICHMSDDPEDKTWWLGFDCAHSGDALPGHWRAEYPFTPSAYETYKDMAYVKFETQRLAEQLASDQESKKENG
jgi:hypothetical protein